MVSAQKMLAIMSIPNWKVKRHPLFWGQAVIVGLLAEFLAVK